MSEDLRQKTIKVKQSQHVLKSKEAVIKRNVRFFFFTQVDFKKSRPRGEDKISLYQ